jgi:hypothetical protein
MTTLMLHNISATASRYTISINRFQRISAYRPQVFLTLDDAYAACFGPLLSLKPEQAARVIVFPVVEKVGKSNDWDTTGPLANLPIMGWEQILELKEKSIGIGSHSATHPDLRKLDNSELDREIKGSKTALEEKLGRAVEYFCYPYGLYNETTIQKVKEAGYKGAFTTSSSIWEGRGNPFRRRRIEIKGTDPEWLVRLKLSGIYDVKGVWELPMLVLENAGWMKRRCLP